MIHLKRILQLSCRSNLADSVIVDPIVSVTFKEGIDPQIISSSSITLKNGAVEVPGTVSISGTTAQFTATGDLKSECEYEATIFTKSTSGKYSTREYSWRFKTGRHHSYNSLAVVSVIPLKDATGVHVDSALIVTFNKELTSSMKNVTIVTLKKGTTTLEGTLSFSGNTARFKPNASLSARTNYNGYVQIGPVIAGTDPNVNNFMWGFTTAGDAADIIPPVVSSAVPANNATSVSLSANPAVTFSETMNPATITSSTFTLKQGTTAVAGSVSVAGATATFKPASPLTANKIYTGTISTGAKDAAGNSLASPYVWSFTTESGIDNTAPTILTVVPASGSITAPTSTKVTVTFSEAMNSSTINSSTISIKQGTTSVAGTVTLSGATATFTPASALAANTVYTGTVTTAVKDAAGNALASNYSWSFTTAAAADITAPAILSVVPANNATAIAVNSKATVTFSEAMDAATITASTFTLKQGTTAVSGVVTYSGTTATFTPSAALAGEYGLYRYNYNWCKRSFG